MLRGLRLSIAQRDKRFQQQNQELQSLIKQQELIDLQERDNIEEMERLRIEASQKEQLARESAARVDRLRRERVGGSGVQGC